MSNDPRQPEELPPGWVRCEMCRKEVPASEAVVPEAQDYLMHFCGLDCYARWKDEAEPGLR